MVGWKSRNACVDNGRARFSDPAHELFTPNSFFYFNTIETYTICFFLNDLRSNPGYKVLSVSRYKLISKRQFRIIFHAYEKPLNQPELKLTLKIYRVFDEETVLVSVCILYRPESRPTCCCPCGYWVGIDAVGGDR